MCWILWPGLSLEHDSMRSDPASNGRQWRNEWKYIVFFRVHVGTFQGELGRKQYIRVVTTVHYLHWRIPFIFETPSNHSVATLDTSEIKTLYKLGCCVHLLHLFSILRTRTRIPINEMFKSNYRYMRLRLLLFAASLYIINYYHRSLCDIISSWIEFMQFHDVLCVWCNYIYIHLVNLHSLEFRHYTRNMRRHFIIANCYIFIYCVCIS